MRNELSFSIHIQVKERVEFFKGQFCYCFALQGRIWKVLMHRFSERKVPARLTEEHDKKDVIMCVLGIVHIEK